MDGGYSPSFSIMIDNKKFVHGVTVDVLSVSVTETSDRADSFIISLRDRHTEYGRFPSGAALKWMDDDALQEGKPVVINMGYVNNLREIMMGEITSVNPSFTENGMPTLNIRGFSLYHRLQRKERKKPFDTITDSGIAEEIARELNLQADVDATSAEHASVSPNSDTYQGFLEKRAKRIGYEFFVKGETLYFKEPGYISQSGVTLTLEWGRNLLSFAPQSKTYGLTTKVNVRGTQTATGGDKAAIVAEASAGSERVKLGEKSASQLAEEMFGENVMQSGTRDAVSQEEAAMIARNILETKSMEYITGRGSCIGNIEMESRKVIEIKSVGKRFSGKYYLTSVTHSIDAGGYQCQFEVKRNAR